MDMCVDDPCESGQTFESTWDGDNAGYICNGGKSSLTKYQFIIKSYKLVFISNIQTISLYTVLL